MKAFLTGATGFVGSRVAKKLRERGDDVVCLVRRPQKAAELEAIGCTIVEGDLSD
ncbi:SDR family oxidoreductase, partial [Salmonella sp. SAL4433]|uniref:SDR family oxidoreductase n=1 Tax=Salmonella sp. SAL4433 TaxID=3159888 RepID=UPI00397C2091